LIRVENLAIVQGAFELRGVSFEVPAGSYGVLMGRTGCGKTSVLECLAGLRTPAAGRIWLNDRDVTNESPGARGVGYLPQDAALFRTMTVFEHLAFALRVRHWRSDDIDARVAELAGRLGIEHLLRRRPFGLSGGEAQRVALGRALSFRPRVLLLDEPLSSLDEETRGQMAELLQSVHRSEGATVLHVTHSRGEAERLGDVHFRLEKGEVRRE
jgi:molybdate/tungstate transport system ATP-binding protein